MPPESPKNSRSSKLGVDTADAGSQEYFTSYVPVSRDFPESSKISTARKISAYAESSTWENDGMDHSRGGHCIRGRQATREKNIPSLKAEGAGRIRARSLANRKKLSTNNEFPNPNEYQGICRAPVVTYKEGISNINNYTNSSQGLNLNDNDIRHRENILQSHPSSSVVKSEEGIRRDVASLAVKMNTLKEDIISKSASLIEKDETIASLKKEKFSLREKISNLEAKNQEHDDVVHTLKTKNMRHIELADKLIGDKKSLILKVEASLKKNEFLESDIRNLRQEMSVLAKENQKTQESLSKVDSQNQKKQMEIWKTKKIKEIKELTVKSLEPEIEKILRDSKKREKDMKEVFEDEIRKMRADFVEKVNSEMQQKVDTNRHNFEERVNQISVDNLKYRKELVLTLTKESDKEKRQHVNLLEEKEEDFKKTQKQLQIAKANNLVLRQQVASLSEKIASITEQKSNIQRTDMLTPEEMNERLKASARDISTLRGEIEKYKKEITETINQSDTVRHILSEKQRNIDDITSLFDRLKERYIMVSSDSLHDVSVFPDDDNVDSSLISDDKRNNHRSLIKSRIEASIKIKELNIQLQNSEKECERKTLDLELSEKNRRNLEEEQSFQSRDLLRRVLLTEETYDLKKKEIEDNLEQERKKNLELTIDLETRVKKMLSIKDGMIESLRVKIDNLAKEKRNVESSLRELREEVQLLVGAQ